MKLSKYILLIAAFMMLHTSCDDGFEEVNINPVAANDIDPGFQFSYAQLRVSGGRYANWRAGLIYSSMMLQHLSATCGYWVGDKYTWNSGYSASLFDRAYTDQVREVQDLINTLETTERGDATMLGMARIWRVVMFHRLTDMYGDIPYFQAGKGFLDGTDFPAYDSQADIYADMLKELEEGLAQLDGGGFGTADILYNGDVAKWKTFGNSMMLRLAMRLSEVDPATAEAWTAKAIAGGVMTSNDDIAMIAHTNGPEGINMNGIGEVLDPTNGFGDSCPRLSATLVDWMDATGDPRLAILGVAPVNGGAIKGMPNGLDETTIQDNPTGTSTDDFSTINPMLVTVSTPMVFQNYAEVEFLQAEAILRGWATGDAATHYNNGVKAAMQMYPIFDGSLAIDDAAVEAYLAANPFDNTMKQIGEQYWIATFLNEYESFSNWRRTGYPELTPVNYDGNVTNGTIPVRLTYPESEAGVNPDNFNAALSRQGLPTSFPDMLSVPVWWDK